MKYKKGSHEEKEGTNRRNGKSSTKNIRTQKGEIEINMPRDREGTFEPIVVPKRKRLLDEVAEHVTLLYAKGNSIRDIKEILDMIYVDFVQDIFMKLNKDELKERYGVTSKHLFTTIELNEQ